MAPTNSNLVTAAIPAFNAARTIERAINSVRAQTCGSVEIVVVDDASTDGTPDIVGRYSDVKLIRHSKNLGPGATRTAAAAAASGTFVAFLDADDEWLPTKLEKQLALIRNNPAVSIVACDAAWVDPAGNEYARVFDGTQVVTGPNAWKALLADSFIATPCVLARRSTVLELGGFDPKLVIAQDQDMWIRLALAGEVAIVPEVLVRIHVRPDSHINRNTGREVEFMLPMIERHIDRQRPRLTEEEIRSIMARRLMACGRSAYAAGNLKQGIHLMARAVGHGQNPVHAMRFVIEGAPFIRNLKRVVRYFIAETR